MKLRWSAQTDVGRMRDHNEDSYGIGEDELADQLGHLFVVCDGMGGHARGEVASRMAVDAVLRVFYEDEGEDRVGALKHAFQAANGEIYADGRGKMGTTGVGALLHHDALHAANVGDSRAYLLREGRLRQLSRDHSFVNDQVAAGLLTAEEARVSPIRNVITRALGHQSEVEVDLFRYPLQVGDVAVLTSDGLHGLVTDDEIAEVLERVPIEDAADELVRMANERGGSDNITVLLVAVDRLDWEAVPLGAEDETPTDRLDSGPAPTDAATGPAPAASAPAPRRRLLGTWLDEPERPISRLGALLTALLLVVLAAVIVVLLNAGPGAPSEQRPIVTTPPAATLAPATAAPRPSPAPTATP